MMTRYDNAAYGALTLRLALGAMFLSHALLKIFVFTPAGTVDFFDSLGVPGVLAYAVIVAELTGGVALIAGFQSRTVVLALLPVLVGSIVLVHGGNGWTFAAKGGGWEYSAFLIGASVAQAFLGDGAYAVKFRFPWRAAGEVV